MHVARRLLRCGALFIALETAARSQACRIAGVDNGVCMAEGDVAEQASFCGSLVRYTACVPAPQRGFPNNTIATKDEFVRRQYDILVPERIAVEKGTYRFSDPLYSNFTPAGYQAPIRFLSNSDCANAYRNLLCWMNFPRCDESGHSLGMCRSTCENFFLACRYPKDMWRCYEPRFYGGEHAEGTRNDLILDRKGNPIFTRAIFPGLPFTQYEEDASGMPLTICTPSLKNAAPPGAHVSTAAASLALLVATATLLFHVI